MPKGLGRRKARLLLFLKEVRVRQKARQVKDHRLPPHLLLLKAVMAGREMERESPHLRKESRKRYHLVEERTLLLLEFLIPM